MRYGMFRYLANFETPKDKTHQKIMEQLDGFIKHLPSEEDKHLFSSMVSECIHKHCEAIMTMEGDDPSLLTPLIMALIVDQNSVTGPLKNNKG